MLVLHHPFVVGYSLRGHQESLPPLREAISDVYCGLIFRDIRIGAHGLRAQ